MDLIKYIPTNKVGLMNQAPTIYLHNKRDGFDESSLYANEENVDLMN